MAQHENNILCTSSSHTQKRKNNSTKLVSSIHRGVVMPVTSMPIIITRSRWRSWAGARPFSGSMMMMMMMMMRRGSLSIVFAATRWAMPFLFLVLLFLLLFLLLLLPLFALWFVVLCRIRVSSVHACCLGLLTLHCCIRRTSITAGDRFREPSLSLFRRLSFNWHDASNSLVIIGSTTKVRTRKFDYIDSSLTV